MGTSHGPFANTSQTVSDGTLFSLCSGKESAELIHSFSNAGYGITDLEMQSPVLEDVFIRLTEDDNNANHS